MKKGGRKKAYILPQNGPKATQPTHSISTQFIHKQTLPAKHRLTKSLVLHLPDHALRRTHEAIFPNVPGLGPSEAEGGDITEVGGGEEDFAWTGVGGLIDFAAADVFLEVKLYGAAQGHCGGHGDHYACEGLVRIR